MKKILSILMVTVVAVSCAPISAIPVGAVTKDKIEYKVENDKTLTVVEYKGSEKTLTIPSAVNGRPVKKLGKKFLHSKKTKVINLPSTINNISTLAFSSSSLSKINVSKGNRKFSSKNGVLYNKNGTALIKFPKNKCKNKAFSIPDGVKNIKQQAFSDSGIKSLTLSKSVKKIGNNVFPKSLKKISVAKNNKKFSVKSGVLYDKKRTNILLYPAKKESKSFKTPKTVKSICEYAFRCAKVRKVIITKNVKNIRRYAFKSAETQKIDIKGANNIEPFAFYLSKTKSIKLPDSLKKIKEYAFYGSGLTSVNIPASVTSIGRESLHCPKLKTLTVLPSVKKIGEKAFGFCGAGLGDVYMLDKNFVLKCKKNSTAYEYGKKNGINILIF